MADFLESSLFRPSAPSENLLKKPKRKKLKVDDKEARYSKGALIMGSPVGLRFSAMTTSHRRNNSNSSNNNNNNNNNNCINNNCSSNNNNNMPRHRGITTHEANQPSRPPRPSLILTDNLRQLLPSEEETETSNTNRGSSPAVSGVPACTQTVPQSLQPKGSFLMKKICNSSAHHHHASVEQGVVSNSTTEVLPKSVPSQHEHTQTQGNTSQEPYIMSSEAKSDINKNLKVVSNPLTGSADINTCPPHSSGQVVQLTSRCTNVANVSDMQEQFIKMNLKRGERESISLTNTRGLIASSSLRETQNDGSTTVNKDLVDSVCSSFTDTEVIKGKNLHNTLVSNASVSSGGTIYGLSKTLNFLHAFEGNKIMRINISKRQKIISLFHYLVGIRWKMQGKKEDKEILVEEEVMGDDDGYGEGVQVRYRIRWPLTERSQVPANCPPDERKRPRIQNVCRAGRQVRRSLSRGCHYIGHGLANMTSYLPDAAYMGPVPPSTGYDCEFVTTDYM
ncbi:putative uncharacterized protein DDB_G0285119 [Procambarus clarkii]|uniref:putative uncharacterized protein DDB_G0285119 n=1 Tax=Procambarus clarkii TaxID=6728 RepID=UPI003742AF23